MRWGSGSRTGLVVFVLALMGVTAAIAVGAVLAIDTSGDNVVGRVRPDDLTRVGTAENRTPSTGFVAVTEGTQEPPVEETATEDGPDRHLIGSNLSLPDPRGTEIAFRDRFKFSSPWISGSPGVWDDGRPIDTDGHGWVRSLLSDQIARTTMMQAEAGYYPGDYVVLYEGRGTMSYIGATPVSSSPGRDVISVSDSLRIDITEVDPSDHLREIRVVPLSEETLFETDPFNPDFLTSLTEYSALRFMNWMRTNGSRQEQWSDRPTPDSARFTEDGGVPVEVMVDLANTLQTDPWFNIPHLADDEYVIGFASVVEERLDPSLIPIVELSNEVGNTTFGQHADYRATGTSLGLDPDPYTAAMKYHSMRSSEVFQMWEVVFGDKADFVAAIHPGTRAMETALDHGDVLEHADMLLVDAYFAFEPNQVDLCEETAALDLDAFFELMSSKWVPGTLEALAQNREVAEQRNLTLGVYEGGHHLRQNTGCGIDKQNAIGELFDRAVADPRMNDAYSQLLDGVVEAGVVLFAHYHNVRQHDFDNRFGARRSLLEERAASPVYDALLTFIEAAE